ncbi:hypothetical protein BHE74_00029219, partial [Ensete ventricosum]
LVAPSKDQEPYKGLYPTLPDTIALTTTWLLNDLRLTPLVLHPLPHAVSTEAFLGPSYQVQALTGMIQAIIPQLTQTMAPPQSEPNNRIQTKAALRNTRCPVRHGPVVQDLPQETRSEAPLLALEKSALHHLEPEINPLELDTLPSDSTDSLRAQLRNVNQRLDKVQKEVTKSKEEAGESLKGGSSFTPGIQDKPIPTNFRLPTLESYNGSADLAEHVAAFRA